MLLGVAASPGIGIGKAVVIHDKAIKVAKRPIHYLSAEKQRFLDAVDMFVDEIEQAYQIVSRNISASEAAILSAQIAIIKDPELIKEVLRSIERQCVNAEYAFNSICNGYIALFSNLEDEILKARAADFCDIKNRMLCILMGIQNADLSTVPAGSVLVADDIPPSQAAYIDNTKVHAIITRDGTKHSHIAIIARALGLPAVVSVDKLYDIVQGGEQVIVDGNLGKVLVNPAESDLQNYRMRLISANKKRTQFESYKNKPTQTADGWIIRLTANLAVPQELPGIRECNADGIGLFRTEFMFMEHRNPPAESEQYEAYKNVVEQMEGRPVTIRTLDVGGDKKIPYLIREPEYNPFMGFRAIRFCIEHKGLFKAQLRAILRASVHGNVKIMIPMITSISELRTVKELIAQAKSELAAEGSQFKEDLPVGIMIETPAAVLCANELAAESDFFSIGTNDLTQYVLAVDRTNTNVAHLYNSHHPAVLRTIVATVAAAKSAGIPVSLCGEAACDPLMIPFLIGAGVEELSVASGALLSVRSQIADLSYREWKEHASAMLLIDNEDAVSEYIAQHAGISLEAVESEML